MRALVPLLLLAAPAALAEGSGVQTVEGSLLVSVGPTTATDTVVWLVGDMAPHHSVDADIIDLAATAQGGEPVTLSWTSDVGGELYVHFYDDLYLGLEAGCVEPVGVLPKAGALSCEAPARAQHVTVNLRNGARVDYVFRYEHGQN